MPDLAITWDEASARYRDARGKFISRAEVRAALDAALAASDSRVRTIGDSLRTGQLSLADWEVAMRAEVKLAHLEAMLAARGGRAFMTAADYGRAGQLIRVQYDYLNAFAKQIGDGLLLDGRFLARSDLYAEAGRATYQAAVSAEMARQGYDEEKSLRHVSDSCDDCIEQESLGWQPLGQMLPIGDRQCLSRCRCSVAYRNVLTGDVAA